MVLFIQTKSQHLLLLSLAIYTYWAVESIVWVLCACVSMSKWSWACNHKVCSNTQFMNSSLTFHKIEIHCVFSKEECNHTHHHCDWLMNERKEIKVFCSNVYQYTNLMLVNTTMMIIDNIIITALRWIGKLTLPMRLMITILSSLVKEWTFRLKCYEIVTK